MTISDRQLRRIVEIGRLSNECLREDDFAALMTEQMLVAFDSCSAVFMAFEPGEQLVLGEFASYGIEDRHTRAYRDRYHRQDPCFLQFQRDWIAGRVPVVATDRVVDSERAYRQSGYYREFMAATRVDKSMVFGLRSGDSLIGLVGLHRQRRQPHYSDADLLGAELVVPYLTTALRFRHYARAVEAGDSQAAASLATARAQPAPGAGLSAAALRRFDLTSRQAELAGLVEQGLTNAQIADRLGLSANTVENHLAAVYRKTGTRSRTALVRRLR
ncbi:MAG: helix-turn-helix transcriptional regulator [Pseudomonadota bacterium]